MHQEGKNIRDLLRRWLSGDSRRTDERRLDRYAEDDPFLADALDGYRQQAGGDHSRRVGELRARLQQRSRRRGALPRWPRAAAAVFLLAVAGGIWWWASPAGSGDSTPALAMEERYEPEAGPEERRSTTLTFTDTLAPEAGQPSLAETSPPAASRRQQQPAAQAEQEEDDTVPEAGIALAEEREAAPPQPAARTLRMKPSTALKSWRNIRGRVSSQDGSPLAGVVVGAPKLKLGTITDQEGQYQLTVDSNVQSLTFDVPGFDQLTRLIGSSDTLDVVLNFPSAPELIADEAAPKAQKAESPVPAAIPAGGFDQFERYLRRQLRYPTAAREKGLEGTVRLQFTVREDGIPTDFKVIESPENSLTEEAIRLLREGPRWELPAGVTENTRTYDISFRLN